MRSFLLYSLARIALFVLVFWLLLFTEIHWMFAGILAAVIAMLISILALGRLRQAAATDVQQGVRRRVERGRLKKSDAEHDAEEEDAIIEQPR